MVIDVLDTRWYWDPSDWPEPAFLDIFKGCADFGNAGAFVIVFVCYNHAFTELF